MINNDVIRRIINSPVRKLEGEVELFDSTSLIESYRYDGDLVEFTVERVGEGKFFGFGVAHKANVKIRDVNRIHKPKAGNILRVIYQQEQLAFFPDLYISEVHRDEKTNQLSITAYDLLEGMDKITFPMLELPQEFTINDLVNRVVNMFELEGLDFININDDSFSIVYKANFDEGDNLREILNQAAEVTQTIYYINSENKLIFKRLDKTGEALETIDKSKYFTLAAKDNRRIQTIAKVNELGDNTSKSIELIGTTQYIRNNSLWELRDDIPALLDKAIAAVGGLTIAQYEAEWRGNPLIEVGDKINLTTKDNKTITTFLLDDSFKYDGSLTQKSQWKYEEDEETETNPSSIGDIINNTIARVDKQNQEIELMAQKVKGNTEEIDDIQSKVSLKLDAEQVQIQIQKQINESNKSIVTGKGYSFNDEGLNITASTEGEVSNISTNISENGIKVKEGETVVLTANNDGVDARNLHATTYLIIGRNSRFEDYRNDRTGCFWIG